jgi:hypothetical protein
MLHGAVVAMGPEHANLIAKRGCSTQDVKQYLWVHFGKQKRDLRSMGKLHLDLEGQDENRFTRSTSGPAWSMLVVSGASNAGVSLCPSITIGREICKNVTQVIKTRTS